MLGDRGGEMYRERLRGSKEWMDGRKQKIESRKK